jgi:DNA repair protein RadC
MAMDILIKFMRTPWFIAIPLPFAANHMAGLTIHELPAQEKPREKLLQRGIGALTDAELLAILLRTGLPGCNVIDLSQQLLTQFGNLANLSRCSVAELSGVRGIGPAKALHLAAAFGLGIRLATEQAVSEPLDTPEAIYRLLRAEMRLLDRESLRVTLLDTRYRLITISEISRGTLNESVAHPREIFKPAITHSAYAFVIVHNHPSGDPSPSEADLRLTRRIAEGARLLQIQLLDHVIIGHPANGRLGYFSFKEAGLI